MGLSVHALGAHLVVDAQRDDVHGALHLPHGGPEVPTVRLHRHPQPRLDLHHSNGELVTFYQRLSCSAAAPQY